jgi:hypothetical protein
MILTIIIGGGFIALAYSIGHTNGYIESQAKYEKEYRKVGKHLHDVNIKQNANSIRTRTTNGGGKTSA